jgi:hypothetical protein
MLRLLSFKKQWVLYVSSDLTVKSSAFVKRLRMFHRIYADYFRTQHSTPGLYNAEGVLCERKIKFLNTIYEYLIIRFQRVNKFPGHLRLYAV